MLPYIFLGIGLVVATVLMHAAGTTWLLTFLESVFPSIEGRQYRSLRTVRALTATVVILILLHALQIELWALAYLYLLPEENLSTMEEAAYFSFVTFTTLGYGDITLPEPMRIMSGIEALNGIMLGGWSTALLIAVVQRIWQAMGRGKEAST